MTAPVSPDAGGCLDRRRFLAAAIATPLGILTACSRPGTDTAGVEQFTTRHDGEDVRCLTHAVGDPSQQNLLAIVLLHGAGADATQWVDIGLVDAMDRLDLHGVRSMVAIAPDLNRSTTAESMILDSLIPGIVSRFEPDRISISGISRGGGQALAAAMASPDTFSSVGLHSPAIGAIPAPDRSVRWPCWVDVGDDDPLSPAVAKEVRALRGHGIDVTEHHWPGQHNRAYWRAHLADYLTFHLDIPLRTHR